MVVLTTFDLDEYVHTALRHGAVDFLLKDASAPEMLTAVRSAARGDAMLSPRVTRRLLRRFVDVDSGRSAALAQLAVLTGKKREVLAAVGGGLSNTDIAARLRMSEATVKTTSGGSSPSSASPIGYRPRSSPTRPPSPRLDHEGGTVRT